MTKRPAGLAIALALAELGWHVFPLSPGTKGPLANCKHCGPKARTAHPIETCPCIAAGRWCHGVRAATTNPHRITTWWRTVPHAVPGIAAGPSGLVLIDIDTHGEPLPDDHATALLPGIDLHTELAGEAAWRNRAAFRTGRDSLMLLARLRGRRDPWPNDAAHQPLVVTTPSGGTHLWYRAPDGVALHQALASTRHGLAWKVDVKAGWSYGIAPGAATTADTYQVRSGDPIRPGRMPNWLAREVIRATTAAPPRPVARPPLPTSGGPGPAAYLATVINHGAAQLAAMTDGRKRALSALAYHAGGLLDWSGLAREHVASQLTDAGTAAGLGPGISVRIVNRAIANGIDRPVMRPGFRPRRTA
jgi:hypothetical protein